MGLSLGRRAGADLGLGSKEFKQDSVHSLRLLWA